MEKIEETEMCIICVRRHSVDLTRISMLFSRSDYCKSVSHANYRRLRHSGVVTRNRYNIQLIRNKFLKADSAAHEALQIFQTDKHPSHVGIGRAKEGWMNRGNI
ncbi:uncharacterized protein LOC110928543 isoform X2 [Helianthus annuus]|uniref:uncharacterized protein LOC110928543 isoform X2 n=1 Tax=Helianthus annuus TaxID=4232 RepID=UPI000B8F16B8|nr:uncharacterized protein LOC110928543 isoform X2 [Helianthus annuus]